VHKPSALLDLGTTSGQQQAQPRLG
jgi:hypothetical protein